MGIKIILSFISVLAIFFISFVTFSNDTNFSMENFSYSHFVSNGINNLYKDKDGYITDIEKSNSKTDYKYEKFDSFDKIFFSRADSYKIVSGQNPKITLKKAKYFLYFTFPRTYYVSGEGFSIKFNGPIKLYIDTEENNILSILPLNNHIELTLFGLDDKEKKTISYIYPHMFFSFKLNLNKILSNTDYFRISQINTINFVKSSLYNQDSLDLSKTKQLDNKFFKDILTYFEMENMQHKEEDNILKANYNKMKYDYISKNFWLLVNKSKKSSYYKDLIYMDLSKIYSYKVSKNTSNNELDNVFKNIKDNFINLKNLDSKGYDEMKELLAYFYQKLLLDKKQENLDKISKYNSLLWDVLGYKSIIVNNILYCVFESHDFGNDNNFLVGITRFSRDYLGENGMTVNVFKSGETNTGSTSSLKQEGITGYDSSKNLKMGYYLTFLENIIKSHIETKFDLDETRNIFALFNEYSLLTTNIFSIGDEDKRKTLVAFHLNLLKELETYLRDNFFEENLDKSRLLVLKSWVNLDNDSKFYIEKAYKNIYNFFEENKKYFDENNENDKLYLTEYEIINDKISDYISALNDYNKYRLLKLNINTSTYTGSNSSQEKIYTDIELTQYFQKFVGVSQQGFSLKKLENEKYYVVLYVSGKKIEFDFFPYDNFFIRGIVIDGKKMNLSYSLKDEEERYAKLSGQINPDGVNSNFLNFFIDRFLSVSVSSGTSQNNINSNNISDNSTKVQDDVETMIFKRDILFAPNRELSTLQSFSDISSNNVLVTFEDGNRNIKLQNVRFALKSNIEGDNNIYGAYIDANYDVNTKIFNNIKLKIFKQESEQTGEIFGLGETKIEAFLDVKLVDFRNYLNNFFTNYNSLTYVGSALNREFVDVKITLNPQNFIKYSFVYKSRNFDITLRNKNIISIKQNGNSKLQNSVLYTSIEKQINLLIK